MGIAEQEKYISEKLNERVKELLSDPNINRVYQAQESEQAAKDWLLNQALITLLYTPEERREMSKDIKVK